MNEGELLHTPCDGECERAAVTRFMRARGFATYDELWAWSVEDLEGFWAAVWDFFGVRAHRPYDRLLASREMPGARWFPGAELNYAEHALAERDAVGLRGPNAVGLRGPNAVADRLAVIFRSESADRAEDISLAELRRRVAAFAAGLRRLGVVAGDRIVAYAPNIPETLVAFLATASLGAIWSSCPPDFGVRAVVDRFRQIEPKVLVAADGYRFKGCAYDRAPRWRRSGGACRRSRRSSSCPTSDGRRGFPACPTPRWPSASMHSPSRPYRSSTRCGCSTRRGRPASPKR